jgi:hypothetical protein
MSSGAAQLPSHRGGRCRHRGAVMGLPSAADAATRASVGCPAGRSPSSWPSRMSGRLPRRSSRCPRPLSAMRTDVRPTWSGGRPVSTRPVSTRPVSTRPVSTGPCPRVRCPRVRVHASGVHAPGVHTTGVIRVSGRTPVRCPRPLQPRWIRTTSVRRDRPRLVHRVRRGAVVGERLGRRCPNRARRARDGRTLAVRGSHEGRRQTWRCFAGVQAAAPRSPPGRPGELVQGQVPVGWWGSRGGAGAPKSPQVRAGRVAGVLADHGLDREVMTTLGGRCAGEGPVSSGAGGPIRFSGEQTAAAARPRYVRGAVRSELTAL